MPRPCATRPRKWDRRAHRWRSPIPIPGRLQRGYLPLPGGDSARGGTPVDTRACPGALPTRPSSSALGRPRRRLPAMNAVFCRSSDVDAVEALEQPLSPSARPAGSSSSTSRFTRDTPSTPQLIRRARGSVAGTPLQRTRDQEDLYLRTHRMCSGPRTTWDDQGTRPPRCRTACRPAKMAQTRRSNRLAASQRMLPHVLISPNKGPALTTNAAPGRGPPRGRVEGYTGALRHPTAPWRVDTTSWRIRCSNRARLGRPTMAARVWPFADLARLLTRRPRAGARDSRLIVSLSRGLPLAGASLEAAAGFHRSGAGGLGDRPLRDPPSHPKLPSVYPSSAPRFGRVITSPLSAATSRHARPHLATTTCVGTDSIGGLTALADERAPLHDARG